MSTAVGMASDSVQQALEEGRGPVAIPSFKPFQPPPPVLIIDSSPLKTLSSSPRAVSNPASPSVKKAPLAKDSLPATSKVHISACFPLFDHLHSCWDLLTHPSAKTMVHIVWILCAALVMMSSLLIREQPDLRGLRDLAGGYSSPRVLLLGFGIAIPIVMDVLLSFALPKVVKDREFGRVYVLVDVLLPNLLMLLHVVGPNVLDLVLFYQFMHILMVVLHRIFTHATLLNVPQLSSTAFREVYVIVCMLCMLAFVFHLSIHGVLSGKPVLRAVFAAGLVAGLVWFAFKLRHWFGTVSTESSNWTQAFLLLLISSLLVVGSAQLWAYPFDTVFFAQKGSATIWLEGYYLFLLVVMSAKANFEVRVGESSKTGELEYNRKMTRTISHEIRTPLNTAFMALELLLDTIQESNDPKPYLQHEIIPSRQYCEDQVAVTNTSLMTSTHGFTASPVTLEESSTAIGLAPVIRLPKDQVLEMVDTIKEACNISLSIVNQLLTFDKLRSGMMQLEPGLLSVLQLVDSNVLLFRMQAQQLGIHLMVFMHQNDRDKFAQMFVFVDEHKINQVIRNLLSNAMKFTPKHGMVSIQLGFKDLDALKLASFGKHNSSASQAGAGYWCCGKRGGYQTVNSSNKVLPMSSSMTSLHTLASLHRQQSAFSTFGSTKRNIAAVQPSSQETLAHQDVSGAKALGFITLSINDSGPGVSAEDQKKLFQEYVQISPGELQKGQGTGLGLSISKAIVQLHGGNIAMTSEGRGKGSTFFIELPAYQKTETNKGFVHSGQSHTVDSSDVVSLHSWTSSRGKNRSYHSNRSARPPTIRKNNWLGPANNNNNSRSVSMRDTVPSLRILSVSNSAGTDPRNALPADSDEDEINSSKVVKFNKMLRPLIANKSRLFSIRSFHILIVDDSLMNRKMLSRLLSREGHICREAEDGKEAVDMVRQAMTTLHRNMPAWQLATMNSPAHCNQASYAEEESARKTLQSSTITNEEYRVDPAENVRVDIILMDYFMKEVHGPEAAYRIREMGFNGPIIGITGLMDEDSDDFIHAGADVVLCKPVTVQAIWKALRTLDFVDTD